VFDMTGQLEERQKVAELSKKEFKMPSDQAKQRFYAAHVEVEKKLIDS